MPNGLQNGPSWWQVIVSLGSMVAIVGAASTWVTTEIGATQVQLENVSEQIRSLKDSLRTEINHVREIHDADIRAMNAAITYQTANRWTRQDTAILVDLHEEYWRNLWPDLNINLPKPSKVLGSYHQE